MPRGKQWHNETGPGYLSESTILICLIVIAVAVWTYPVLMLVGAMS